MHAVIKDRKIIFFLNKKKKRFSWIIKKNFLHENFIIATIKISLYTNKKIFYETTITVNNNLNNNNDKHFFIIIGTVKEYIIRFIIQHFFIITI